MSLLSTGSFAGPSTALFSRPLQYGSFSSTQTQVVNPAFPVLAVLPLVYDTVDLTPTGMSCAVPSANIVVGSAGVFKVLASAQCDKTTLLPGDLEMWVAVNGTAVPNSATRIQINQNQETVMTVEWLLELDADDAISVNLASTAQGLQALAIAAAAPVPAIPSIITTVIQIS